MRLPIFVVMDVNGEVIADGFANEQEAEDYCGGVTGGLHVAEMDARALIAEDIHALMSGQEWSPDTLQEIAAIFERFGWELKDIEGMED